MNRAGPKRMRYWLRSPGGRRGRDREQSGAGGYRGHQSQPARQAEDTVIERPEARRGGSARRLVVLQCAPPGRLFLDRAARRPAPRSRSARRRWWQREEMLSWSGQTGEARTQRGSGPPPGRALWMVFQDYPQVMQAAADHVADGELPVLPRQGAHADSALDDLRNGR